MFRQVYITTYPMEHPLYGVYKWQFNDDNDDVCRVYNVGLFFQDSLNAHANFLQLPRSEIL